MTLKGRYGLSTQFIVGLENLSKAVREGDDFNDFFSIQQKNLASILFSVNCIEAKINELVGTFEIDRSTRLHNKIQVIATIERKISIVEKYNLVCLYLNEELWDSSKEPYQSFEIIQSLRNEIVHFKGKYEDVGLCPTKLKNLFTKIECKILPKQVWLHCLLSNKNLCNFILKVTKEIDKIIDERISKNLV